MNMKMICLKFVRANIDAEDSGQEVENILDRFGRGL